MFETATQTPERSSAMPEVAEMPVANPRAELPPRRASLGVRAAPFFVWGWGFGWTDLGLLLGMYVLTALGITVGFHRLFVHRSFETYTWVKFLWAALGSM